MNIFTDRQAPLFVADDNGHSHHKIAYFEDGVIKTHKVEAIVGDGSAAITDATGEYQSTYDVDGKHFVCNAQIQKPLQVRNVGYQTAPENKALMAHVIDLAGLSNRPLIVGTTLPWQQCFHADGKANSKEMTRVGEFFCSGENVKILSSNSQLNIVHSKPYVEGLAAFFDWALTNTGEPTTDADMSGPVAVVDIGGSTTEIVTILSGSVKLSIDHSRSGNVKKGVIDAMVQVKSLAEKLIRENSKIDPSSDGGVPDWMVKELFNTGRLRIGQNLTLEAHEDVAKIKSNIAAQLLSFIQTTIGNTLGYQAIIFVGGGSIVFKDQLESTGLNTVFLNEFSNAIGALKYMHFIEPEALLASVPKAQARVANTETAA
jgi:plasmid segregation protein ParM